KLELLDIGYIAATEIDHGVEAFGGEVDGAQAGRQVHGDARMRGDEPAQARGEPPRAEGWQDGDGQGSATETGGGLHAGALEKIESGGDVGRMIDRCVGGHQPLLVTHDQGAPQLSLEARHLTADSSLRKLESPGRGGGRSGAQ